MRNLSCWKNIQASLQSLSEAQNSYNGRRIYYSTFDVDEDALLIAAETIGADGNTDIEMWKFTAQDNDSETPSRIATYSAPRALSSVSQTDTTQVINMRLLPDTRTVVLITRTGELLTILLEDTEPQFDVVGSVEAGLTAAAWCPDDSLLVLATGDEKLIVMTSTFDVLTEGPLHPSDFGEDAPIALGWGDKKTQFHGSLGKSAAQAGLDPSTVGTSPDDDNMPHFSWRGDGAYFSVSSVSHSTQGENTRSRRMLRVYSREGALSSTAEPVAGLEHALAWRPSGNLIASTQRFGSDDGLAKGKEGRHDLVFFERNGLRHGEFGLREWAEGKRKLAETATARKWGYRVKELGWSSDSNVLSVWIEGDDGDFVQLWTTGNYHWYLKQEIEAPHDPSGCPRRFTSVTWHPEDALRLILTTATQIIQRTYIWETCMSRSKPPNDTGSVAVFDGAHILLTPFRTQNVPPPMSAFTLNLSTSVSDPSASKHTRVSMPAHAAFGPAHDVLALLWESGHVELYDLHTRVGPGRGKVMTPEKQWAGDLSRGTDADVARSCSQVVVLKDSRSDAVEQRGYARLAVLMATRVCPTTDVACMVTLLPGGQTDVFEVELPSRGGRLLSSDDRVLWQAPLGDIFEVPADRQSPSLILKGSFPEFCTTASQASSPYGDIDTALEPFYIGLALSGKLYVVQNEGSARMLANNATSFTIASDFLIHTTSAHTAHFAPLNALLGLCSPSPAETDIPEISTWETRRVERGSRIVTAVPSTMSLVLQMPRGNLETINPRPLVMAVVRQDVQRGEYGKAFMACRKHRIDFNVLVEQDQDMFKRNLPYFVEQVDDVDYVNLFLTSIGQGGLPAEIVSELCDGIRGELERRDLKRYVSSILTAHVVKRPPDHEAALSVLLRLKESEPQLVEEAVKYIIFLIDADRLFDTALGMYDFSLVLLIAQHSQKDPREYLPFLRELRAVDPHYQRFRIDDHLKRYEKALKHLSEAGPERFDEAMTYVEKHQLYDAALAIWRSTAQYKAVLNIYGDWLFERRDFRSAAFVFREASRPMKAMIAHEKALEWQELFEVALQEHLPLDELSSMAYRVADDLAAKKRHMDAARVLLDYAEDVREAVKALVEGSHFSEARRIIFLRPCPGLLVDIVHPGALDCRAQLAEDMHEMREQLRKQVTRLRELRVRKVEEPNAFYGVENVNLHDIDVMTDVSMAPTAFTRYTQAPSSVSRTTSKRSSRSKRKLERKVGSGRKGTVDEEEYLLKSVTKLVGRFNTTQADAANLLPHLLQFTEEHQREAHSLQADLQAFEEELRSAIEETWAKLETEGDRAAEAPPDGWAARMQEHERQQQANPLEKVGKPELAKQEWKLRLPVG
ncbi:IkappaB kinase complex, IKAP component [Daedalea quercina L-15889]|uniref:Elongator complex protein 1 n=1 Tax=Daedalea quercina L-15889 TaxID=1314783 RepID=A0A165QMQ4_9APHY|nr:IkappaB kinase complex, IKAP component [Daedalea quercina L-15889]